MSSRAEKLRLEELVLKPYAVFSRDAKREHAESGNDTRLPFQRDRDRIIHSRAFRRLAYKTQVFVYYEDDRFRNRLTHSMEVAQIGRSIARELGLNEDLADGIGLAHDLGHPPFGHSGEHVLDDLLKAVGGFNHQEQGYRIVTEIERRHPEFAGLNLTLDMLEGLRLHVTFWDTPTGEGQPSLEGQVANVSDIIAYSTHDIDDCLTKGLISPADLKGISIWHRNYSRWLRRGVTREAQARAVSETIGTLVADVCRTTLAEIRRLRIRTVADVRAHAEAVVRFSPPVMAELSKLKDVLYEQAYQNPQIERMESKSHRFIRELFEIYRALPSQLPVEVQERMKRGTPLLRVVGDYIASMTDQSLLNEYKKLTDPFERV